MLSVPYVTFLNLENHEFQITSGSKVLGNILFTFTNITLA